MDYLMVVQRLEYLTHARHGHCQSNEMRSLPIGGSDSHEKEDAMLRRPNSVRRGAHTFTAALFAFALLALVPVAARAGMDVDLRGGYYADSELAYFGGGLLTGVSRNWYFNPNVEIAPGDLFTVNGDFHYDFASTSGASIWAGAGPAILVADRGDGSDTDVGLNLFMGVGAARGGLRPFGQLKGILADNSQFVLTGGVRF
jgi:hypothetical protein